MYAEFRKHLKGERSGYAMATQRRAASSRFTKACTHTTIRTRMKDRPCISIRWAESVDFWRGRRNSETFALCSLPLSSIRSEYLSRPQLRITKHLTPDQTQLQHAFPVEFATKHLIQPNTETPHYLNLYRKIIYANFRSKSSCTSTCNLADRKDH